MSTKAIAAKEEVRAEAKRKWQGNATLRAEFGHDFERYLSFRAADAAGQVRILEGGGVHA